LVQRYWTNFARTGDPNTGSTDPVWPKLTATQDIRLNFAVDPSPTPTTVLNFRADLCNFWSTVYNAQFPAP
jgi:carboxylesterase type B